MRVNNSNISEFELVPSDLHLAAQKDDKYNPGYGARRQWRPAMLWRSRPAKYCAYTLPLLLAIAPVVLLIAFSSQLSHRLGSNGCTPSGEFVIPYTTSIWDPSRFFAITIAFVGPTSRYCSWSSSAEPGLCTGYNFTQVKVIDIAWDILVGRGAQAVAVFAAYHVFGRVVKVLMQQGEVGYDLFSAVAFDAGSVSSFATIARHATGFTPIPRTRRAIVVFAGMAAATLYLVVVPSLLAAMTGYTSYYDPSIELDNRGGVTYGGTKDCFGPIVPLWGLMEPITVGIYNAITWQEDAPYPISFSELSGDAGWIEYYNRYRDVYEACPVQFNISGCKYAHQATKYNSVGLIIDIPSPMPGIIPYDIDSTGVSKYTHWSCAYDIFTTHELHGGNNTVGICNADNGYAWGFSFLLTFVTAVLTLLFVLIMYGLWFEARRHNESAQEVGHLKDAVTMVTFAQQQYGPKIGEWSSDTLQREIVAGKVGMSFADYADDVKLRRRKVPTRREQEYGDPRAGDWGGEVYVSDLR